MNGARGGDVIRTSCTHMGRCTLQLPARPPYLVSCLFQSLHNLDVGLVEAWRVVAHIVLAVVQSCVYVLVGVRGEAAAGGVCVCCLTHTGTAP